MRLAPFEPDPMEVLEIEALDAIRKLLVECVQVTLVNRLFGSAEVALEELAFPDWPSSEVRRLCLEAVSGLLMLNIIIRLSEEEMANIDPSRKHLTLWRLVSQDIFDSPESRRGKWYADISARYPLPDVDV